MFEQYPMIHYEFSGAGTGIQQIAARDQRIPDSQEENLSPIMDAEYTLRGYVNVLPVFPQADDALYRHMHLQSFSHMYSLADYFTSRRSVESFLLVYTVKGHGKLEYEGNIYHLSSGDIFWIDCRSPHRYMSEGSHWEHIDIHLYGSGIAMLYQECKEEGSCIIHLKQTAGFFHDVCSVLDNYLGLGVHRNLRIAHSIEKLLVHLITENDSSLSVPSASLQTLQKLISYMQEHFREPLTLDQLSSFSGLSKYHLSREFRKFTGLPPNEYLIRLRLEQAKTLLVNTDLTVSRTAAMSGFENEAYFSRIFHKRFNMTPMQYRRENSGVQ